MIIKYFTFNSSYLFVILSFKFHDSRYFQDFFSFFFSFRFFFAFLYSMNLMRPFVSFVMYSFSFLLNTTKSTPRRLLAKFVVFIARKHYCHLEISINVGAELFSCSPVWSVFSPERIRGGPT